MKNGFPTRAYIAPYPIQKYGARQLLALVVVSSVLKTPYQNVLDRPPPVVIFYA